jgi:hypothetical protein
MCPHTTKEKKLSKKEQMLLDLLYMCPHTTVHVSSYCYTCVKEKKLSKKEQMLLDIAAKKAKGTENKLEGEWKELLKSLEKSTNASAKIKDLDDFCRRCQTSSLRPHTLVA